MLFFWTVLFKALRFILWLIRPNRPLRHRRSGVPPFGSIASFEATHFVRPSMAAYVAPKKILPWIFFGLQNRGAILHVAKPPSMARYGLARKRKSFRGFSGDCRIAGRFCTLLSRHPWLVTGWQGRENPSVDFREIAESRGDSARC